MNHIKPILLSITLCAFSLGNSQEIDNKVKKKFAKIDADNDGLVNLKEMAAFYEGKTNNKGEAFDIKKMLAKKDADGDGLLSLAEFASKGKNKKKKKN